MPPKRALLLQSKNSLWIVFLKEYFSDVSVVFESSDEKAQAAVFFDKISPTILFLSEPFLTPALLSKIRVCRNTDLFFRAFYLGGSLSDDKRPFFHGAFPGEPSLNDFSRRFVESLPMPDTARVLVVDDEKEVGGMICDYFEGRKEPSFEIVCVSNGKEGLAAVERQKPSVIILDIKMPVMDGREFYVKLQDRHPDIPVIVFFDSISSEELAAIRQHGHPAVVEKGYQGSSMPALLQLVKKTIYFSI